MATSHHQGDLQANAAPFDIRRKKIIGQQKREALEREVSMLQKMLKQEETMHEILESLSNKRNWYGISIPSFLPTKVKELLAELAMVEGEIARLEGQISQLQLGLKNEQQITKTSKQWHPSTPSHPQMLPQGHFLSNSTHPSPLINKGLQEKVGFETKALHFISKAIKGDYNLNDFTFVNQKAGGSPKGVAHDQKENQVVGRKSGFHKSPSPLRDPRFPSPKPKERNAEMSIDVLPKSVTNTNISEENMHQWQPNKLSESIIKCLNFIYVRLLRTSRAMELEKAGPVCRSLHASLISRSFRAETNSNASKSNLMMQKESRQQDPYGIFDVEECIPRDIGPYKNLVIFTSSSMDPKFISSPSSIPLLKKLRVLMSNLQSVDLRFLTHQQKVAFWINMYNACIMHGFLQYGVPSSPEKLLQLMNKATINIGGNTINAQAIEHYILRMPTSSNKVNEKKGLEDKEAIVRKLYGLELMDPNVTFALCCGTRSSPAVRVYTGEGVRGELEKSKLEYLQASVVVTTTKRIGVPELLHRHLLDFAMDTDTLVEWVCCQLPTSVSLRKSIVDCFRSHHNTTTTAKLPSSISVEKLPYDFDFQYLLAI